MRRRSLLLLFLFCLAGACSDGGDNGRSISTGPLVEPLERAAGFGPWAVGHQRRELFDPDRNNRALPYDVWYPVDSVDARPEPRTVYPLQGGAGLTAQRAVEDLPVAQGSLPLLVFSHGFGGTNTQSVLLMETLASHGFVVVSPEHSGNTSSDRSDSEREAGSKRVPDVSFMIDTYLALSDLPGSDFYRRIDGQRIGVLGHSFGGGTALGSVAGFYDSPADPRVAAAMPISATVMERFSDEALASVRAPVLFLGGSLDQSVPLENHDYAFDRLLNARAVHQVDIFGATHTHFANICDIGNWLIDNGIGQDLWPAIGAAALLAPFEQTCSDQAFPIEQVLRIQNLYAVAFFRRYLNDERGYDYYLQPEYAAANEPDIGYRQRVKQ